MCPDLNHFTKPRGPRGAEDISQQLRGLPPELPAPYDWAEFSRRSRDRFSARRTLVKWPHAAAAAGLTVFVAAMAMVASGDRHRGADDEAAVQVAETTGTNQMNGTDASGNEKAIARSTADFKATREWLARQPSEPALVRVGPRLAVANLEDRIAWFDDAVSDERLHGANTDSMKVLQQERARLMSSLAQVRYAEALATDGS